MSQQIPPFDIEYKTNDVSSGTISPPPSEAGKTDVVYQDVKVFVEGVEIPFINVTITQGLGGLPSCELSLPPSQALLEITRYYQPKLHIFFRDNQLGGYRLLFWGHLFASSFMKTRDGGGSTYVQFSARHKNFLLRQIMLGYTGVGASQTTTQNPGQATASMPDLGSSSSLMQSLKGIDGTRDSSEWEKVEKLDKEFAKFEKRLIGMPGVLVNLWNQIKRTAYANAEYRLTLLALYIPLFEQGLSMLKRLSGHYVLEKQQQDSRMPDCNGDLAVVPPNCRTGTLSTVAPQLALEMMSSGIGTPGEMLSFMELCERLYASLEYHILTLSSPAEIPVDPEVMVAEEAGEEFTAVETVIAPELPYYYSPVCNVILPKLITSIHINQNDGEVPTRTMAMNTADPAGSSSLTTNYRGPHTIREAQAYGAKFTDPTSPGDLPATSGEDYGVPGKYEMGRGVMPSSSVIPQWLTILGGEQSKGAGSTAEVYPARESVEYDNLIRQLAAWNKRHGIAEAIDGGYADAPAKYSLNPFSPASKILPHEKLIYSAIDYYFTKSVISSRAGTVEMVFNPYIIPGYPVDILDDSPNSPCFHAFCTSVTHSITASSISTTVGVVSAVTYTELYNYFNPPVHPWLDTALGMINPSVETQTNSSGLVEEVLDSSSTTTTSSDTSAYLDYSKYKDVVSTLIQNPKAKGVADQFYLSVLGVGAADPTDLVDPATGQVIPQGRLSSYGIMYASSAGSEELKDANGGDLNWWNTTEGNLRIISRPIETLDSISEKFRYNFISLDPAMYHGSNRLEYSNPNVGSNRLLEPGASIFLDYMETPDLINKYAAKIRVLKQQAIEKKFLKA